VYVALAAIIGTVTAASTTADSRCWASRRWPAEEIFTGSPLSTQDSESAYARLAPVSTVGITDASMPLTPDEAGWFLVRLAEGDGLAADDPIAALRNRTVKMRMGGGGVNETEALALVVMAWNARRAGETRSKLQLPRVGLLRRTSRSSGDLQGHERGREPMPTPPQAVLHV
jgi:hypothetical protein